MTHLAASAERPRALPELVLAAAVLAVSTGAIFVRLADAPALAVAFWRCGLAALLVAPFGARPLARALRRASAGERWTLIGAGCALALHFAAWISSLERTSVASSVMLVNTTPLWVGLLTPILSSDRISRGTVRGIAASVAGCAVVGAGDLELSRSALLGDALALAGGAAAALYFLAGRRLRRGFPLAAYVFACYGTAAVVLGFLVAGFGVPAVGFSPGTWGWLVALAVVPQLIGHSAYNWALRWVSAALVAVALLGEPIGATLLAWWILGEAPGARTAAGGALILAGIWWAARGEGRAKE